MANPLPKPHSISTTFLDLSYQGEYNKYILTNLRNVIIMKLPPYLLDLVPYDFWRFHYIKDRFDSCEEEKELK